MMASVKGVGEAPKFDKKEVSSLQIGIVHARWNTAIISALVEGAQSTLQSLGVPSSSIHVQSVPGSYELPFAAQRMYAASQTTVSASSMISAATDLLSIGGGDDESSTSTGGAAGASSSTSASAAAAKTKDGRPNGPLDAIIAIGVLIKGETMHFEYIADAASHGLMRVQLDTGCPVIFGLLTCLNETQAFERAGVKGASKHNHAVDWAEAAVELAVKRRGWLEGKFIS